MEKEKARLEQYQKPIIANFGSWGSGSEPTAILSLILVLKATKRFQQRKLNQLNETWGI